MAEPQGPLQSPGFWLHHASLTWRRRLDSRLADVDLTHTQFNLLASASWLGRTGETPTQQQAADMAGADRMMASKIFASLERRGLIVRSTHPGDSRAKGLTVTPAGREKVGVAVRIVADIDEEMFGPPGTARNTLRGRLRHLVEADPA